MNFQITVRYGSRRQRYHTFEVEATDARQAMARAAPLVPDGIAPEADLVEIRVAVDPEQRPYVEGS